jgi:hydrogenase maturation protease
MKVLVAGIGNVFMGDDGFGCEVVRRLSERGLPQSVEAIDFGTGGTDLGFALTEGYDAAILVDTVARGGAPGTVYVIDPEREAAPAPEFAPHEMDPAKVLRFATVLGTLPKQVRLVGCEPAFLGGEDGHLGLSSAAAQAVDKAIVEIELLLNEWCSAAGNGGARPATDRSDRITGGSYE